MSEAAFTLSTAPIWSARTHEHASYQEQASRGMREPLTALANLRPDARQLDEDDVPEAQLRVVRDGHDARHRAVVEHDRLVVLRVPLCCGVR